MKKLEFSESQEYSSLNKLGPVQKILTQSQNSWEEWKLEDVAIYGKKPWSSTRD